MIIFIYDILWSQIVLSTCICFCKFQSTIVNINAFPRQPQWEIIPQMDF
jgi:hypothetical protein